MLQEVVILKLDKITKGAVRFKERKEKDEGVFNTVYIRKAALKRMGVNEIFPEEIKITLEIDN